MKAFADSALAIIIISFIISGAAYSQKAGWVKGDFHQHTTFTDGNNSFFYMMQKNYQFGLDWWANSEHGGAFYRNGYSSGSDLGKTTNYWDSYNYALLGTKTESRGHQGMWRWQAIRDVIFPGILVARNLYPSKVILQGLEWNSPGHEHTSMGCLAGQLGKEANANVVAEFEYKFDEYDKDDKGGTAQGWAKSKESGHDKTIEAVKWLQKNYKETSWTLPNHPERRGEWAIEDFRDMNNAAPDVCFGFEGMPGHQKAPDRGEYSEKNDSEGDCTYGGAGIFLAKVGGLWDALLTEGRRWWIFANSDYHHDEKDFFPGEYQANYTYVKDITNPNEILNGMRSGNSWIVMGGIIDNLEFKAGKAVMGETYTLDSNAKEVEIYIKVHDPQGNNFNTYSDYKNPVMNHIDLIAGQVKGKINPGSGNYDDDEVTTTSVIARFDAVGGVKDGKGIISSKWKDLGDGWKEMSITIKIDKPMYFRLRGTNHPLNAAKETDSFGNPLPDNLMEPNDVKKAFADLWFYSNPIFVKK